MLRLLVLLLLLANGTYFVWSQGMLREFGLAPALQGEPQRLAQQTQAASLRILPASEARALEAAASAATTARLASSLAVQDKSLTNCLQAGFFDEPQARKLRPALVAALGTASWSLDAVQQSTRWLVYMGKYGTPELLQKKRVELREIQVPFTEVSQVGLAPGLSLGVFENLEEANNALARLNRQGVRTAKVVPQEVVQEGYLLKLPEAGDSLRARVDALGDVMAGKTLQACP